MKRWFVARIVEEEPGTDTWVPKVALYPNVNFRIWSKAGFAFCLGQLGTNNIDQLTGDNDIRLIPDASLDNLLNTIPTSVRNAMTTGLTNAGFDLQGVVGTWSFRRLLKHLKLQLQSDDNIESGDVLDTF